MAEKKTPTEILEEVLEEQHKLFEEAVADGAIADIIDIGGEITKTVSALLDARGLEVLSKAEGGRNAKVQAGAGPQPDEA